LELVKRVGIAVRMMGAQSVITSRTIADRFGIHTTDLEVLDLIFLRGQVSAGELVDATGLTSGSVTALIDRLAKVGYVDRYDDPSDRRKVLIRIRHDAIEPIKATYTSMQKRMFALWSTFEPHDLEVIVDFITRSTELHVECCKGIQQRTAPLSSSHRRPARASHRGQATPVALEPRPAAQTVGSSARTKQSKKP
jgi:DNA-binding MarR family transcriptional regulator